MNAPAFVRRRRASNGRAAREGKPERKNLCPTAARPRTKKPGRHRSVGSFAVEGLSRISRRLGPPGTGEASQLRFPRSGPDGQPIASSQPERMVRPGDRRHIAGYSLWGPLSAVNASAYSALDNCPHSRSYSSFGRERMCSCVAPAALIGRRELFEVIVGFGAILWGPHPKLESPQRYAFDRSQIDS